MSPDQHQDQRKLDAKFAGGLAWTAGAKWATQVLTWTSTLVVPIPKNAATYQQVSVDGVIGTLIQRPADDAPQYVLLWVKNGVVYAIGGLGADTQKVLQMANSLQ